MFNVLILTIQTRIRYDQHRLCTPLKSASLTAIFKDLWASGLFHVSMLVQVLLENQFPHKATRTAGQFKQANTGFFARANKFGFSSNYQLYVPISFRLLFVPYELLLNWGLFPVCRGLQQVIFHCYLNQLNKAESKLNIMTMHIRKLYCSITTEPNIGHSI